MTATAAPTTGIQVGYARVSTGHQSLEHWMRSPQPVSSQIGSTPTSCRALRPVSSGPDLPHCLTTLVLAMRLSWLESTDLAETPPK
jgi:hypothetical protein